MAQIQIELFTDRTCRRYVLGAPWILPDGRVAATDTYAAIVCDRALVGDLPPPRDGRPPNVLHVLKPIAEVGEWSELPPLPTCDLCKGKTIVTRDCTECKGMGSQRCNLEHDHDCDQCGGSGVEENIDCPDCKRSVIPIGNVAVKALHLRRAHMLPGCRWGMCKSNDDLILLKFDCGIGALARHRRSGE